MEGRYLKTSPITSTQLSEKRQTLSQYTLVQTITNDDCSILQINLTKIHKLVTELSPSTKTALFSIVLGHDKSSFNVKVRRGNEIIKQFCKTNKLDLIDNLNMKDRKFFW